MLQGHSNIKLFLYIYIYVMFQKSVSKLKRGKNFLTTENEGSVFLVKYLFYDYKHTEHERIFRGQNREL